MNANRREFERAAAVKAADPRHRAVIRKNLASYHLSFAGAKGRFLDWENARSQAAQIKWEAVNHLDRYLVEFERNLLARGGHVHWAETADDACRIIIDLARRHQVRKVVKAKSMTTEEIHLNDALEAAGIQPIETDLGEYICQIRNEPPYHILTPAMHLSKGDIARDFHEKLGVPLTDDAEELTMVARQRLRREFLTAEMGVTGANFAVADLGMVALTENEGNIRLSFSLPRLHVALVGIEKVIPRLEDLAVMWPVLSAAATGQTLSAYNSLVGPRAAGEVDGPDELHVILLDNGRTRLLADVEQRDALQCIRCGACLNACPVYEGIGGHAYGTPYQGPIGSVITPHLRGVEPWSHLSQASSLCGACTSVCPVRIDLHRHLLHNRRNAVTLGVEGRLSGLAFRLWLWAMRSPARYRLAAGLGRLALRLGLARRLLRPWTATRALPPLPAQTFRQWWAGSGARRPAGEAAAPGRGALEGDRA